MTENGKIRLGVAVVESIPIIDGLDINASFRCAGAHVIDVGAESTGLDASMVFAIEFTQGFIATLQKVVEIKFAPEVTETIVQDFVANLSVFIACH